MQKKAARESGVADLIALEISRAGLFQGLWMNRRSGATDQREKNHSDGPIGYGAAEHNVISFPGLYGC
jgi:hypothetical protein